MNTVTLTGFLGSDREIRETRERSYTARRYESLTDELVLTVIRNRRIPVISLVSDACRSYTCKLA